MSKESEEKCIQAAIDNLRETGKLTDANAALVQYDACYAQALIDSVPLLSPITGTATIPAESRGSKR